MYSLRKFASRSGSIGKALPETFPSFSNNRIVFRHGTTSMIAGHPGAFKSVIALNLLATWVSVGQTAMYFSADSDEYTVAHRMTAILTGTPDRQVDEDMSSGAARVQGYYEALAALDRAQFVYRALELDGIVTHLRAFEAIHGGFPDVVFVDNLMDFCESSSDWEQMRTLTRDLDTVARETRSHIVILHHASESVASDGSPPPRFAIQGKVTQKPRLVLSVGALDRALSVSCVKNTNGPQYPMCQKTMPFLVGEDLRVEDLGWRQP